MSDEMINAICNETRFSKAEVMAMSLNEYHEWCEYVRRGRIHSVGRIIGSK